MKACLGGKEYNNEQGNQAKLELGNGSVGVGFEASGTLAQPPETNTCQEYQKFWFDGIKYL